MKLLVNLIRSEKRFKYKIMIFISACLFREIRVFEFLEILVAFTEKLLNCQTTAKI